MDFSQYLQTYLEAKRLRGVTPTVGASTGLFAPYFNRQAAVNATGKRLDLAEKDLAFKKTSAAEGLAWDRQKSTEGLAWNREKMIDALALQKWQNEQLMNQAARGDTYATIGNAIQSAVPIANYAMLKKFGYLR